MVHVSWKKIGYRGADASDCRSGANLDGAGDLSVAGIAAPLKPSARRQAIEKFAGFQRNHGQSLRKAGRKGNPGRRTVAANAPQVSPHGLDGSGGCFYVRQTCDGGYSSMVEPQIVVLDVAGSNPVSHPTSTRKVGFGVFVDIWLGEKLRDLPPL